MNKISSKSIKVRTAVNANVPGAKAYGTTKKASKNNFPHFTVVDFTRGTAANCCPNNTLGRNLCVDISNDNG